MVLDRWNQNRRNCNPRLCLSQPPLVPPNSLAVPCFPYRIPILHQTSPTHKLIQNSLDTQITNSAPSHAVLGTLNGLAQTLSAAGRAVGPFLSGGLFSLATRVFSGRDGGGKSQEAKAPILAFGVFAAVSLVGLLLTLGIGEGGEVPSDEFDGGEGVHGSEGEGQGDGDGEGERDGGEEEPLLSRRREEV